MVLIFLFAGTGTFLLVRGWRSSVAMPTMAWNTGDQTHRWAVCSIHLLTNPSLSIAVLPSDLPLTFVQGVENTRRFLLEWLSFLYRYIPIGLLERVPQRINERPPSYEGRDELETLMSSNNCHNWIKIRWGEPLHQICFSICTCTFSCGHLVPLVTF